MTSPESQRSGTHPSLPAKRGRTGGAGGALFAAVYILFGNLPFLIIQRYNRPRLVRLLAMQQRRSAKQNQQPS